MPIPDYQTLMLPLLRICADGREHRTPALAERVADEFGPSEEERRQRIPSGTSTVIANRTHWALTYMAQARLLERPRRGFVRITDRGRQLLASRPGHIDNDVLSRFEDFLEFRRRTRQSHSGHADGGSQPFV